MADPTQEELRNEFWSQQAKSGWGPQGPDAFVTDFYGSQRQEFEQMGKRPHVVDIGCGTGTNVIFFAAQGCEVVGIEPAPAMRARALEAVAASGERAEIIDGTSGSLPLQNGSIDLVLSLGVSHHGMWKDAERDIAEIARILRPGGYLLFRVRSINDMHVAHERLKDIGFTAKDTEGPKKGIVQHYFSEEELRALGKKNSLDVIGAPIEQVQHLGERKRIRWYIVYRKR